MGGMDMVLELILVGLLIATLIHALRLQRALGGLRADRSALNDAVQGFDSGTRQAEAGLARMHEAADRLATQLERSTALRDDLAYLADRGEGLADRLDTLIRAGRPLDPGRAASTPAEAAAPSPQPARPRSQAERNLMAALQGRR